MLFLVGVCGPVLLSGCESTPPPPATEQAVALTLDAPKVTVLSTGQAPKMTAAYEDKGENRSTRGVVISKGFQQKTVEAASLDDKAPSSPGGEMEKTRLDLEVDTTDPSSNEEQSRAPATRAVELRLTSEPDTGDSESTNQLSSAKGFRYGWRAQDNGQVSEVQIAAPVEATQEAREHTESLFKIISAYQVVFPTEDIGVGAQWQVETRVALDDAFLQTTTYTVKSMSGDTIELGVQVQQRPTLGALHADNHTLNVLHSTSNITGTVSVNLKTALPTSGSFGGTTRVIYGEDSSPIRIVQDSTTRLEFNSAE
ncbi:hypothetical protein GP475_07760 [Corynebacterium poyangense]|uniref:Uncharacterized protein n=1 Tax=Corynebacterium poyangense TaxID=2684405 RepID=A0A7H0SPS0_9CORY|nr:DUF6263 family protein [Corynebacterium poyangense]QNQ90545.1 hypothetical protein GP475_07760 [Corynebacterium poyangense]